MWYEVDNQKACDQDWTYFIGHIKKSKHMFFKMFFAMHVNRVTPRALPNHDNLQSQHPKNYKNHNLETRWKVIQKIQLFTAEETKKSIR